MIGYVCKYTPVELIVAFGEEARLVTPPGGTDGARAHIHPNLCGYAKALLAACAAERPGAMVFTDCCDALKRAADTLERAGAECFRLGLPRGTGAAAEALFAGEVKLLAAWLAEKTGAAFGAAAFRAALQTDQTLPEGGYIAVMGARAPQELMRLCAEISPLPVADLTCGGAMRGFGPPPQTEEMDELLDWYAARLLRQVPCMRMRDASGRAALLDDPNLKGIVYHTIKFCDFYGFEHASMRAAVPVIKLETDYTLLPEGQIRTRLEAFMESNGFTRRQAAGGAGRYFAGIDSGSTSTNVVILDENGGVAASCVVPTGAKSGESAARALEMALETCGLEKADIARAVATGYGRKTAEAGGAVTEITCHAKGAHALYPQARTVIDIGGQDSKVIRLDADGNVKDFSMNDKCAAGTGRFLELMADTLGMTLEEFSAAGQTWGEEISISSMCAVFAESEVISLIAQNKEKADIIHGVDAAIAGRVCGMAARISAVGPYVMTGGVAMNGGVAAEIGRRLGQPVLLPKEPQLAGALGAALLAMEQAEQNG